MAGQKTINNSTPAIGAIKIQQSTFGLVLPIVWGQTRITGNLIWYGDFKATPHTEVTQSGGKGGAGAPRQTNTTYTYSASVAMALCEGPLLGIRTAWRGKKIFGGTAYSGATQLGILNTTYGGSPVDVGASTGWSDVSVERVLNADLADSYKYYRSGQTRPLVRGVDYTATGGVYTFTAGAVANGEALRIKYTFTSATGGTSCLGQLGMDLYRGNPGQTPWSYLTTNYPAQALGYSSIAYVAAPNYSLDDGAAVENHAFEVQSAFMFSSTIPDANPAPIVADALSNPQYGAGFGAEKIGAMTDYTAACTAQGIFLSPALTAQLSAAQFLSQMALLTNVGTVWSGGVLKFVPYTDTPVTANGVTFTPNTAPIYDLTDDDFQSTDDEGPVKVNRGSTGDTFNQINIEFSDRANAYNVGIVPASDQADIQENGLRAMPNVKADWICDAGVAKIVAQLILQRTMFVRNTYEFTLGWTKIGLEPMDLVTLTDVGLGLSKQPVRILTMEEDENGYLAIVAEDFPKGSASATLYPSASGSGFAHDQNESPGTLGAPVIFEAPAALAGAAGGLELWLAVGNNSLTYGGCEIWVSLTGSNYQRAAVINGASRFGTTTSAMVATSGTTTETVGVSLTAGGQLLAGTTADMNALSTLCYVGGEFMGYETATLTGGAAYTIGNHMLRGAYLSTPAAHASGSVFVRCDEAIARMPLSPDYIGKTMHVKVLPFNRYGGGLGDLASATDYTYAVTGAQANNAPVAPGGLALEGAFTIDTAKFKWNAVSNAATYNVQMFNGATMVRQVNVGNALRYDYSSADAKVDGGPWRSLTAKVQGINANGAVGPLASLGVSNPQMAALTGVAFVAAVGGAQFSCALPTDQDFLGIQVCMSTTSGFTPGSGNVVYDGPSTTTAITGLTIGTPYYFRAGAYDTFDKLGITFSSEFTVTPTSASIANNSITAAMLQAGIVDLTKFASGIEPVTMVTSVPTVHGTNAVFNTTDSKLYRWNGSAYVTGVAAGDVSGTLGDAQIAALAASKITGTLGDAQIAALAAAKLTGQIVTTQITDGSIATAKLAAGAVTAGKIATDTITANEIAAGAITASELAAGAVVAGKIAAGTIQAGDIAAGAITTSKMLVTSKGQAINDDPACEDITAWSLSSGIIVQSIGSAGGTGVAGGNYFRVSTYDGANPVLVSTRGCAVDPAKTYTLNANIYSTVGNNRAMFLLVEFSDVSGAHVATSPNWGGAYSGYTFGSVPISDNTWHRVGGAFGAGTTNLIPANAASMKIGVIFQYSGSGTSSVPQYIQDIRLERVNDGSLIVDGAIVASKLAVDSVTAGKIAAAAISAREIQAGAITTDRLAVRSSGATLNADPNCADPSAWVNGGGNIFTTVTDGAVGNNVIRSNVQIAFAAISSLTFPISAGKVYRATCKIRSSGGTKTAYFRLMRWSSAASLLGYGLGYESATVPIGAGWTQWSGTITAESGAHHANVEFDLNWTGSNDGYYVEVQDVRIEEVLPGTLIQDGAITTNKILAGAVTANEIASGTITAAKIAAGTLTATQIQAGSIITDSLVANGVSATDIFASGLPAPGNPGPAFVVTRASKVLILVSFGASPSSMYLQNASSTNLQTVSGNAGENGIVALSLAAGTYYLVPISGTVTFAYVLKVMV